MVVIVVIIVPHSSIPYSPKVSLLLFEALTSVGSPHDGLREARRSILKKMS